MWSVSNRRSSLPVVGVGISTSRVLFSPRESKSSARSAVVYGARTRSAFTSGTRTQSATDFRHTGSCLNQPHAQSRSANDFGNKKTLSTQQTPSQPCKPPVMSCRTNPLSSARTCEPHRLVDSKTRSTPETLPKCPARMAVNAWKSKLMKNARAEEMSDSDESSSSSDISSSSSDSSWLHYDVEASYLVRPRRAPAPTWAKEMLDRWRAKSERSRTHGTATQGKLVEKNDDENKCNHHDISERISCPVDGEDTGEWV